MIFNSSNGKKWRICKAKHYLRGGKETDIYYPIPESVSSEDDFQGSWYYDAEHTLTFNP